MPAAFTSLARWSPTRPGALVVACSDGRLQQCVDSFLEATLGITDYDRLLLPGGPGALVPGVSDFLRCEAHRGELAFLLRAHAVEQVVAIFHGPAAGGPAEAVCADYRRRHRLLDAGDIARQQELDAVDLARVARHLSGARVSLFRAEVTRDARVAFVELFERSSR